jgi:uncharacterized protein YlzI (FlbEa/FlbD family)
MSLNHNDIENISNNRPETNIICTEGNPCIVKTPEVISVKREREVKTGQGEGETR